MTARRITELAALILLFVAILFALPMRGSNPPRPHLSVLRRAFEAHEKAANDCWGREECYGMPADFVLRERWKNFQRYSASNMVDLSTITKVVVGKTQDSSLPVITLIGVDGHEYTFWLDKAGKVTDVTP